MTTTSLLFLRGVLTDQHLTAVALLGLVIAMAAPVLFGWPGARQRTDRTATPARTVVLIPAGAGAFFPLQAWFLNRATTGAVSSVLLGATGSVLVVALIVPSREVLTRQRLMTAATTAVPNRLVISAGDATYLFALSHGVLATASFIAQLHPLWTALIAYRSSASG